MAQFLRPDSNVTQTSFNGGFAEIDEATASNTDFAYSDNGTLGVLEVGVSDPSGTPDSGTCTVRWRLAKTNAGTLDNTGNTVTVLASVIENTTVIQSGTSRTATSTWTEYSFTFSSTAITDWTDVRLRFEVTTNTGGAPTNRRGGAISWAEIETPDPAPPPTTRYVFIT